MNNHNLVAISLDQNLLLLSATYFTLSAFLSKIYFIGSPKFAFFKSQTLLI